MSNRRRWPRRVGLADALVYRLFLAAHPALLDEDGLHPSFAGHTVFARTVVERLTA